MKVLFLVLLLIHAAIHLLGFVKSVRPAAVKMLKQPIPKIIGLLWLVAAALFLLCAILFSLRLEMWWIISAIALLLSQVLIFRSWRAAKAGTLINLLVLLVTIPAFAAWNFTREYKQDVATGIQQTPSQEELLTEADLAKLPDPVKKYLRYTGAVGQPKVKNFKVTFTGRIRSKAKPGDWMSFTSEQYNFVEASQRFFFMKATMKHLPVNGYHRFEKGNAFMDIRLLSLFRVQYETGKEMGVAETVTFFNDMCCMAPATLIDPRIRWETTDDSSIVKAIFTNENIPISATLYFDSEGRLVNFVSEDRYAEMENGTMQRLRWSTPLTDYQTFGKYRVAGSADAVYTYPEGEFSYGTFRVASIDYNCVK